MENDQLDQLIDRWEALRQQGKATIAEEICADHPELLDQFKEQVRKLKLFESAFGDEGGERDQTPGQPGTFCNGRYRIESVFDQGGLGILYIAFDSELGRRVIIKGMRPDRSGNFDTQRQFVNEATITGQLEHPGIVPVYGFGRNQQKQPYYAMRRIHGTNFATVIREYHQQRQGDNNPKTLHRLLQQFRSICLTIHYAHSRGIIHRDIKPENVMVGKYGEVLVVDWGLAKHVFSQAEQSVHAESHTPVMVPEAIKSLSGTVKGSPMYMSPEQAAGETESIGKAADIYSLGVTLYELLTGRGPFHGSFSAVLSKVIAGDFPPPRAISLEIPRALEAICLKAMQCKPQQRYASAEELADEVESFITGEPVKAHPETRIEKARRWARKNRTLVTTISAALLVTLLSLAGIAGLLAKHNYDLTRANETIAKANAELQRSLHVNQMTVADTSWRNGDLVQATKVLEATKPELRSIEYNLGRRLVSVPPVSKWPLTAPVTILSYWQGRSSSDGKWLLADVVQDDPQTDKAVPATALINTDNHTANMETGVGFLAFSLDGQRILRQEPIATEDKPGTKRYRLSVMELGSGRNVWKTEPLEDQGQLLRAAAFVRLPAEGIEGKAATEAIVVLTDPWATKPNGEKYRRARFEFRDPSSGKLLKTVDGDDVGQPTRVVFTADGQRAAIFHTTGQRTVSVMSTVTGSELYVLRGHTDSMESVVFSDDGKRVATSCRDRFVRIFDGMTGELHTSLSRSEAYTTAMAFSPSGDQIAVGAEGSFGVRLSDVETGEVVRVFPVPDNHIRVLSFSRDGKSIYAAGSEGVIHRISTAISPLGHSIIQEDVVERVRLSPTGDTLAAVVAFPVNEVRVFDCETHKLKFKVDAIGPQGRSSSPTLLTAAYSPDGQFLAIGGDNYVRLIDMKSGQKVWDAYGFHGPLDFTPDGKRLIAWRRKILMQDVFRAEQMIDRVQDGKVREQVERLLEFKDIPTDDQTLIQYLKGIDRDQGTGEPLNRALIAELEEKSRAALVALDAQTGKQQRAFPFSLPYESRFAMHPTQPRIAVGDKSKIVFFNLETGKQDSVLTTSLETVWNVAFGPDGEQIVVMGLPVKKQGRISLIIDAQSGAVLHELGVENIVDAVFTTDGRRFATSCLKGTIHIWDTASGQILWTFTPTRLNLATISLSKNGKYLAVGGGTKEPTRQGELIIWDVSQPQ